MSRQREKKMQHDILTEVHSSSSTSYRYRNELFVDGHRSICVTAGTHPDYMRERKEYVRVYINSNNLFSRS
jgi:hypothetical protein